jgi:hypothetical protein
VIPPKLTIVIPTYNRPQLLPRALRSAVRQTVPVAIVVADDGDDPDATAAILDSEKFRGGCIRHLRTGARTCWANWRAGLQAACTPYACILQDDDVVRGDYAERIVDVMDFFPDANLWMARLACAYTDTLAVPNQGCGPLVPLDMLTGRPARWLGGEVIAASSYATSWSLAPALAYRTGPLLDAALMEMPEDADMFIERLLPAAMAVGGPIVVDPIVAGYWIQHGGMLSTSQNKDPLEVGRQISSHIRTLDGIMDRVGAANPGWPDVLRRWRGFHYAHTVKGWLGSIERYADFPEPIPRGRYLDRVIEILNEPFAVPVIVPAEA